LFFFCFSVASGLLGDMLKAERFVLERVKSLGGNKKKRKQKQLTVEVSKAEALHSRCSFGRPL
jgi:hypothetical protein